MKNITLSLLDRLIDEHPTEKAHGIICQTTKLKYQNIGRDLENLLNTHCRPIKWNTNWTELENSIINYGIPDFLGYKMGSKRIQQQFCQHIAEAIRRYETRLSQIAVTLHEIQPQLNLADRYLSFRIEAVLQLSSKHFDTIIYQSHLNADTRHFSIKNLTE